MGHERYPYMAKTPVIPVAVIGMACRLPGGINTPEELWQALLRGDDLVTEVPSDRWDGDEYYDPEPGVPGRSVSKWGSFIGMAAPLLFPISSTSADELRRTAGRLAAWVAEHADTVTPSDNVAEDYWQKPEETERTFGARIVGPSAGTPEGPWLRTGDLGAISDGELFIMGRIEDVLIVYGRNHYPDDIEATIQEITNGRVAAISIERDRTEQLVAIIEVDKPAAPTRMPRNTWTTSNATSRRRSRRHTG